MVTTGWKLNYAKKDRTINNILIWNPDQINEVEVQHSSEWFLRWLLSFSTSTVILLWGGKYTQNRESFVNPRALEPECARWFSQSVHCQVSALRVMFFLSISSWCWEFKGNAAALSCLYRARRVVNEESKNKPAALLVTRVTRKCSFPLLNDRLHPVKGVKEVHWKRPAAYTAQVGGLAVVCNSAWATNVILALFQTHCFWLPALRSRSRRCRRCWSGRLDSERRCRDSPGLWLLGGRGWIVRFGAERHAHVIVEFRHRGLYYNAGIMRTLKCNVVSIIFCQMWSV